MNFFASCTRGAIIFRRHQRHLKTHWHYHDMGRAFYTPALQRLLLAYTTDWNMVEGYLHFWCLMHFNQRVALIMRLGFFQEHQDWEESLRWGLREAIPAKILKDLPGIKEARAWLQAEIEYIHH